jgi:hypothetical protein
VPEMTPAAQAAAELVEGTARLVEAPEGEQPAPEVETEPEPFNLDADVSGIEGLLDDPLEEEEDDEEPPEEDDTAYDEYDPNQLQARLKKAEKQLKWSEEQRVTQGRKNWKAEAERRFPLADVDEITATSRRGFLKAADASHKRYKRKLTPILAQLKGAEKAEEEARRAEDREREAGQWGRPRGGPQQPLTEQAEAATSQERNLDRRNYGGVKEMVKARLKHDPNFQDGV